MSWVMWFFQAEKDKTTCKAKQIHKMTTIFTQKIVILWLCSGLATVTFFSAWDKLRDSTAKWSKPAQM